MRLSIVTIGKMKAGPESALLQRYLERTEKAGKQLGFSGPSIQEWTESRALSADQRKEDEGKLLLASLKPAAKLIVLDEAGNDISSVELSALLRAALDTSVPEICFAIGGPDGHSEAVRAAADHKLRLGKMTWPHQLVRVLIAEQLYRSVTILSGHPYHRA